MNTALTTLLEALPRRIRREAQGAWTAGIPYMAGGVVWGANGSHTAIILARAPVETESAPELPGGPADRTASRDVRRALRRPALPHSAT